MGEMMYMYQKQIEQGAKMEGQLTAYKEKLNRWLSVNGQQSIDLDEDTNPAVKKRLAPEFFDAEKFIISVNKISIKPSDVFFNDILRDFDDNMLAKVDLVGLKSEIQYAEYKLYLNKRLSPSH